MPRDGDIDLLLAQWAELLKVRYARVGMLSYRMTYRSTIADADQHYDADPDSDESWQLIHEGFIKNLDARIEDLEAKLREKGVTVTRPSRRE
jgi:hypothetical protein